MQKIVPFLWFDKDANEAAKLYTSVISNSSIKKAEVFNNTPSDQIDIITINLSGQEFQLMRAGPYFKFNPSISFHIKCNTKEEVDEIWKKISEGGKVLMELGEYPFSERYGWCEDKYGVSWQVIYSGEGKIEQKVVPALMFVGKVAGRAEEAIDLYTSVFKNAKSDIRMRYGKGEDPDKEGTIKFASLELEGLEFGIMDSAHEHNFAFNEAISFLINCKDQEEVDYFWEKFTADGGEESECGWLKDKFGVSWQVVPERLTELSSDPDKEKADRVIQAMLKMQKIIVADIEKAAEGK